MRQDSWKIGDQTFGGEESRSSRKEQRKEQKGELGSGKVKIRAPALEEGACHNQSGPISKRFNPTSVGKWYAKGRVFRTRKRKGRDKKS